MQQQQFIDLGDQ